jgi:hypothetical protein
MNQRQALSDLRPSTGLGHQNRYRSRQMLQRIGQDLKQIPVKVVHNLHAESTPHIGLLGGS